jgi:hypothetical protein
VWRLERAQRREFVSSICATSAIGTFASPSVVDAPLVLGKCAR